MEKKMILIQMMIVAILLAYPFYDSISNDARSMDDLTRVSRVMVYAAMALFFFMMLPFFKWAFNWLNKWVNGK